MERLADDDGVGDDGREGSALQKDYEKERCCYKKKICKSEWEEMGVRFSRKEIQREREREKEDKKSSTVTGGCPFLAFPARQACLGEI